jgi:hypothetical protein
VCVSDSVRGRSPIEGLEMFDGDEREQVRRGFEEFATDDEFDRAVEMCLSSAVWEVYEPSNSEELKALDNTIMNRLARVQAKARAYDVIVAEVESAASGMAKERRDAEKSEN